jgi:hypothetical protein
MSKTWPLCPESLREITFLGRAIAVHELAVAPLELVEARALRSAYGVALAEGRLDPAPTGAYVCRNRRPYPEQPVTWDRHSEHAHGIAVDVNYDDNRLRTDGVLVTDFDRFGYEDGVDWLAAWLEPPPGLSVLFRWGGGWVTDLEQASVLLRHNHERIRTGTVDPMHFELALSPEEVRRYDWAGALREVMEVNQKLEQAVRFLEVLREQLKPGKDQATVSGAAKRIAEAVTWVESQRKAP